MNLKIIGVFVVPEFDIRNACGGAENICKNVVKALSQLYKIVIFHGESDKTAPLGIITEHVENVISINSFYIDNYIVNNGEIDVLFCKTAKEHIIKTFVLLSFERCLKNYHNLQICVLGGISYKHCIDIACSKVWDCLIVPSDFIKNKCIQIGGEGNIRVIYNGIKTEMFYSFEDFERTHAALLPFRPDHGKGYFESIDFISEVNRIGMWGQYHLLITKQNNNVFANSSFYDEISKYSSKKNVRIEYIDWQKNEDMNSIYNAVHMTLALGTLEEGFGLTTIESILAGTPVISRMIGATPELVDDNNGIIFVDDNYIESTSNIMYRLLCISSSELKKAKSNIEKKYSEGNMVKSYIKLIKEYERND